MAKHDKHAEQEAWDNDRPREDGFPEGEEGGPRGPGLGREVKIGLAIVAVLLVALGTVAAFKLRGSSAGATAAADGQNDADKTAAGKGSASVGSSSRDGSAKEAPPVAVPFRAGTSGPGGPGSKNPRGKTIDDTDWSVASDSAGSRDNSAAKLPPFSPMTMGAKSDGAGRERPAGRPSGDPFGAPRPPLAGQGENTGASPPAGRTSVTGSSDPREFPDGPSDRGGSLYKRAGSRSIEPDNSPSPRSRDLLAPLAATGDRGGTAIATEPDSAAAGRGTQPPLPASPATGGASMTFRGPPVRPSEGTGSVAFDERGSEPGAGNAAMGRTGGLAGGTGFAQQPLGALRSRADAARSPDGTYEVQPNENFYVIADKLYGTPAYFQALMEHNRRQHPGGRLKPGDVILAPSVEELTKSYPALCPRPDRRGEIERRNTLVSAPASGRGGRIYVVQEGDTLYDIARYELGKARRWAEIYELNREVIGKQFDYLTPGMQLVLPDSVSSLGPVTQRPGSGLNR